MSSFALRLVSKNSVLAALTPAMLGTSGCGLSEITDRTEQLKRQAKMVASKIEAAENYLEKYKPTTSKPISPTF